MPSNYPSYLSNPPSGNEWFKTKTETMYIDSYNFASLTYHRTEVCYLDKTTMQLTLNTGGYSTFTTKKRMNDFLSIHNIPLSIYQNKGNWFIRNDKTSEVTSFNSPITIITIKDI